MKAMLLAAGRGERLKPLTDKTPKPLLMVGKHSLIEHNINQLKKIGVDEVVINICHHAEQIMTHLGDGSHYGLDIHYSYEKGQVLGTGGGIVKALPLLGKDPFIVMSADIWTDFSFDESFMSSDSEAHLVFVDNPYYHPSGDYALNVDRRVILQGDKLTYANIAKLHPHLFSRCCSDPFPLSLLFNEAIAHGTASGQHYRGCWFNVGTVQELKNLRETILR